MKSIRIEAIKRTLLERFGEPIGDREAVPTSNVKKDMKNRGFGAEFNKSACCKQCGMQEMDQSCGCEMSEEDIVQKAPPGGERVVKALKKDKKVKNPWAVAWSMKNRGEI